MTPIIAKIKGEENLEAAFAELFHVVVNLRESANEWENVSGGYAARNRKKIWERKADNLIKVFESGEYEASFSPSGTSIPTKIELIA